MYVCVFCTMKTQVVFTLNLHNSRTFPFWADESFAAACKIHADFQSSTRGNCNAVETWIMLAVQRLLYALLLLLAG